MELGGTYLIQSEIRWWFQERDITDEFFVHHTALYHYIQEAADISAADISVTGHHIEAI